MRQEKKKVSDGHGSRDGGSKRNVKFDERTTGGRQERNRENHSKSVLLWDIVFYPFIF